MGLAEKITMIGIAAVVFFLLASSLIIPLFRTGYEEGFGTSTRDDTTNLVNEYCTTKGSLTTCSDCNNTDPTSAGYELFLNKCHSLVARLNGTHCYACSSFGFRTVSRGLLLLIFVLGIISVAIYFLKK